ncbi:hypothetical protein LTR66_016765 [Elasticomyces elasticus]|nr:hypothetical protein LTR66_016765 [Elasticomyces elasticus]
MLTFFLTAVVVLSHSEVAVAKPSLWSINIDNGPAPLPNKGPPISAHADRDQSHLKWEVLAIILSWLGWITLTAIAILIVGRRLRRKTQTSDQSLKMDYLKPQGQITMRQLEAGPRSPGIKSPGKMASIRSWAKTHKQGQESEASVTSTIDTRVIEADRAKNMDDMAKLYAAVMAQDADRTSKAQSSVSSSPQTEHQSPLTPLSPHFQPNIQSSRTAPPMPPAPQHYHYQQQEEQPPLPPINNNDTETLLEARSPPRKAKPSALSLISNSTSRLGSSQSNKARPSPITVRGQPISKPLGLADLRQSALSSSQQSLPQAAYSPGPPPPTPGKTPVTIIEEYEMHGQPRNMSQQEQPYSAQHPTQTKTLPFRQFYQDTALKSAPPTKTTFLDRRASDLQGPKTGVPKTPYSPYCPSTPMTPITPKRMLTKQEIKANMKQNQLRVVKETDVVKNETDTWGYSHEQD